MTLFTPLHPPSVQTHLRLRRGRFFLNEVTKLIFLLWSETTARRPRCLADSLLRFALAFGYHVSARSAIMLHVALAITIIRMCVPCAMPRVNGSRKFLVRGDPFFPTKSTAGLSISLRVCECREREASRKDPLFYSILFYSILFYYGQRVTLYDNMKQAFSSSLSLLANVRWIVKFTIDRNDSSRFSATFVRKNATYSKSDAWKRGGSNHNPTCWQRSPISNTRLPSSSSVIFSFWLAREISCEIVTYIAKYILEIGGLYASFLLPRLTLLFLSFFLSFFLSLLPLIHGKPLTRFTRRQEPRKRIPSGAGGPSRKNLASEIPWRDRISAKSVSSARF